MHLNIEVLNDFVFKRLEKIKSGFWSIDENESQISPQNIKLLEFMSIRLSSNDPNNDFFNQLSQMNYLKVLKIHCYGSGFKDEIWAQNIVTIASNCVGLQNLDFQVRTGYQDLNPNVCFQSISYFHGIKTLSYCIYCEQPITDLSALKNCKNLLVLKVITKGVYP